MLKHETRSYSRPMGKWSGSINPSSLTLHVNHVTCVEAIEALWVLVAVKLSCEEAGKFAEFEKENKAEVVSLSLDVREIDPKCRFISLTVKGRYSSLRAII